MGQKEDSQFFFTICLSEINQILWIINIDKMIEVISKLEVSINQRFDHISMLTIDSEDMATLIKDD